MLISFFDIDRFFPDVQRKTIDYCYDSFLMDVETGPRKMSGIMKRFMPAVPDRDNLVIVTGSLDVSDCELSECFPDLDVLRTWRISVRGSYRGKQVIVWKDPVSGLHESGNLIGELQEKLFLVGFR